MSVGTFAKIVKSSSGKDVLFYVEPDGDNYILHQITQSDLAQADLAANFEDPDAETNEKNAYALFDKCGVAQADLVTNTLAELFTKGGSA